MQMEIIIYQRQKVHYEVQNGTTCLVPKFACCVAGPSQFFPQRFSIERSRTASPVAVLQRAIVEVAIPSSQHIDPKFKSPTNSLCADLTWSSVKASYPFSW